MYEVWVKAKFIGGRKVEWRRVAVFDNYHDAVHEMRFQVYVLKALAASVEKGEA